MIHCLLFVESKRGITPASSDRSHKFGPSMRGGNVGPQNMEKAMNQEFGKKAAIPLPQTIEEWDAVRKPGVIKLNDIVDRAHRELLLHPKKSDKYRDHITAAFDEESREGATYIDDVRAAEMLRDHAVENRLPIITAAFPLAAVIKSHNIVLRRYKMSRKERRYMVGEETVPPPSNGD